LTPSTISNSPREKVVPEERKKLSRRAVPEWIGAHPDVAIPRKVKARIWARCDGRCALSGRKIQPGDAYDFDHITALANGGEHRESNLQLVCREAHKAKTQADRAEQAKTERLHAKHNGYFPKSPTPLRSRNTFKKRWQP